MENIFEISLDFIADFIPILHGKILGMVGK